MRDRVTTKDAAAHKDIRITRRSHLFLIWIRNETKNCITITREIPLKAAKVEGAVSMEK